MATSPFTCYVLLVVVSPTFFAAADSSWNVKYLPGFSGSLPFQLETGYVGVGDSDEVQLFYYFVKSQGNPKTDPLMTWYTGGPGCSSLTGFLFEIGPVGFKVEPYNGSLPQLILNPYTWTKKANILFIDTPVDSGFSYGRTVRGSMKGDYLQVEQNHQFLRKWLADHPEFISNPFYVGGDSYTGIIIPPLTQAISEGNKHASPVVNLQGYIEGSPVTIRNSNENFRIPFAHGMSLISSELYESLTTSCKGEYQIKNIAPNNLECKKHVETFEQLVSQINYMCISWPYCEDVSSAPQTFGGRRSLYNTSQVLLAPKVLPPPSLDCQEYRYFLGYYWANDNRVRKALHIREGTTGEWVRCQDRNGYNFDIMNSVPYHANLSTKGYRSLIFSGDHDMNVPSTDTEAWIKSLNYSIVDDWRPWFNMDNQVVGYTRTYANNMTFATIKGGGHTPEYMQYQSGLLFDRWIAGESL